MSREMALQFLESGQVWFAKFAFAEDDQKGKDRPVLILDVDEQRIYVVAIKITSSAPFDREDFVLRDWKEIPLKNSSTLSPRNVMKLPIEDLRRYVGYISERDWNRAIEAITAIRASKKNQSKGFSR